MNTKPFSFLRKSVYSALAFFGTLIILSVGYATWNSTMPHVGTGSGLTSNSWNTIVDNLNDLNSRSSSMPCFSAYSAVSQYPATSVATKVALNTKEYDVTNAFDATTNYRFQPTVAGYYQINAGISMSADTNLTNADILIYKDGAAYYGQHIDTNSGNQYADVSTSTLVYLNGTTDYIELWGAATGVGANRYFFTNSGMHSTRMTGCFVHP